VVDDQLTATLEQIGQRRSPVRCVELVRVVDALPRELAPEPIELVALTVEGLFSLEQCDACLHPAVVRHHFVIDDGTAVIRFHLGSRRNLNAEFAGRVA